MRLKRIIFWTIIVLVLALAGIGSYAYYNAQNILNQIIKEEIIQKNNENESSKYYISLEKIKLNLLNGSFKLINLNIVPKDSLVTIKNNINKQDYSNTTVNIHVSEIALTGFDYMLALRERVFVVESFIIESPHARIYQFDGIPAEESINQDTIDIRHIFLLQFDTFRIQEISVKNASTSFFKVSTQGDTVLFYDLDNLSYQIKGVVANKETLFTKNIITYENYLLESRNIQLELPNGAKVKIGSLDYSSEANQLHVENVNFEQKGTPTQFFKTLKYRKSWMSLSVNKVTIDQFDIDYWFDNNFLYASEIEIVKPKLTIYSNANIPFDSTISKSMLGEMIMKIPLPFKIDEVKVEDAEIKLDMIGKMTNTHGLLVFHDMNINVSNITNQDESLNEDKMMVITANTKINKTGKINTSIKIDLKSPSSLTSYDVEAYDMKLKNFNAVLKPILRVSIKAGDMRYLQIKSVISNLGGFGTMHAHYTNLKLQLESKKLSDNPGFFNKMASGMANGVLKTENLPENKSYHQGNFRFKKEPTDSFFKMLWLVALNGLEDSILGSDKRDQRRVKKQKRQEKAAIKKESSQKKKIRIFKKAS